MRLSCNFDYAGAASSNSFAPGHVLLYSLRYLCALFGVHELLPVRRHASNGSLQHASAPPPRLTNILLLQRC